MMDSFTIFEMKWMNNHSGASLLEVLISMSLFSFFAIQTVGFCLKLHNLTRQSLYDTQNVVIAESETHAAIPKK